MTTRSIVTALVVALMLMAGCPRVGPAGEVPGGQDRLHGQEGGRAAQVRSRSPRRPASRRIRTPTDCVTKAETKFDGGLEPAKGCFEKLENKDPNDCLTVDDTAAAETAVDACVAALVAAIDPPPLDQTKCGAGKKKCASKYLAALLKCRKLAQTPGKPTDPNTKGCVDKAVAKYTGGLEPTKGCFAKLEAKDPNDCQSTTNSPTVQGLVGELRRRSRRRRRRPGEHDVHHDRHHLHHAHYHDHHAHLWEGSVSPEVSLREQLLRTNRGVSR